MHYLPPYIRTMARKIKAHNHTTYTATRGVMVMGQYLHKGDHITIEQPDTRAARLIASGAIILQ